MRHKKPETEQNKNPKLAALLLFYSQRAKKLSRPDMVDENT